MAGDIKFRIDEFNKFHNALMNNAPKGYKPHYFLVEKDGKNPDGKGINLMTGKGYSWKADYAKLSSEQSITWIKIGGNIGIAGTDGLINVDIDNEKYVDLLPDTLTAISRSRKGKHGFYWKHPDDKILPINLPTDFGEVRSDWQYVLAPGSYVPSPECRDKLAGYYTVEKNQPPKLIRFDELPFFFKNQYHKNKEANEKKPKIKQEQIKHNGKQSALFNLEINDIVSIRPGTREGHPLHNSETGANFSIKGGLAHCWRHLVSLNALQFLTIKSGYMSCQDAGTPHKGAGVSKLDDGAIFHAWVEAKKSNLISNNDIIPTRAMIYIATKHNLVKNFDDVLLPIPIYNKVIKIVEEEY